MRRREFITLLGGAVAAWPLAAHAEQRDQQARVGILTQGGALANPLFAAFREEMRRLGYVEDRNLVLEFRSAADDPKRLPELAAELVRLPVDVILVEGTGAAQAPCPAGHGEEIAGHLPGSGLCRGRRDAHLRPRCRR